MSEFNQELFAKQLSEGIAKAMGAIITPNGKMGIRPFRSPHKATITDVTTTNWPHGVGGYLNYSGLEPEVISAMLWWQGIGDVLPLKGVRTSEILLPFITGIDRLSDTERSTPCGNCISGETEACVQAFPSGLVCRETKQMKPNRIIERLNRGDIDLQLLNDVLGGNSPWQDRTLGSFDLRDILNIATAWALLFELPPLFMDALVPMVYTGNPTNNQDDGYREFRGLELLVNINHVHAIENVTCEALDADLKDFNYGDMARDTVGGYTWYQTMEMMEYFLRHNARRQRLWPANWVITMRPEQWQIASGIIPLQAVQAAIMNASVATGFQVNLDGATLVRERDAMRESMLIPLNGRVYRVVEDDGIFENDNANNANLAAGEYAADMYMLPLNYLGNRDALWIEYKDFRYMMPEIRATGGLIESFFRSSSNGMFNYTWVKDGPCYKIQAELEPRLILRTPQLSGRLQNVKYVPQQHLLSPDQDSPYRKKGGTSTSTPPTRYY
jgi:hypothetical protein